MAASTASDTLDSSMTIHSSVFRVVLGQAGFWVVWFLVFATVNFVARKEISIIIGAFFFQLNSPQSITCTIFDLYSGA